MMNVAKDRQPQNCWNRGEKFGGSGWVNKGIISQGDPLRADGEMEKAARVAAFNSPLERCVTSFKPL